MSNKKWMVRVLKRDTHEIIRSFPCGDDRIAEKIERGILINLNHDDYYTDILMPENAIESSLERVES